MYKRIVSICLIAFFFISLALPSFAIDQGLDQSYNRSVEFFFQSRLSILYTIRNMLGSTSWGPVKPLTPLSTYTVYYNRSLSYGLWKLNFNDSSEHTVATISFNYPNESPSSSDSSKVSVVKNFSSTESGYELSFTFTLKDVNIVSVTLYTGTAQSASGTFNVYIDNISSAVSSERNPSRTLTEYQYGSTDPVTADDGWFAYATVPPDVMFGTRLVYQLHYGDQIANPNPITMYRNFYIYLPANTPIDDIVISPDLLPYYKGYSRVIYSSTPNTVLNQLTYYHDTTDDLIKVRNFAGNYNTFFSAADDSYPIVMYALQFDKVPSGIHAYFIDFPFPSAPSSPDYLYVIPCFETSSLIDPNQFDIQDYIDGLDEILTAYTSGSMDYYIARINMSRLYRDFLDKAVTVEQRQLVENYNISYRNQLDEAAGIDTSQPPSEYYYSQFGDLIDGLYVDFTSYSFSYDINTPIEYDNDVVKSAFSSIFDSQLIISMLVLVASFATIGYVLYGKKG